MEVPFFGPIGTAKPLQYAEALLLRLPDHSTTKVTSSLQNHLAGAQKSQVFQDLAVQLCAGRLACRMERLQHVIRGCHCGSRDGGC
jgi:hypothetical protein